MARRTAATGRFVVEILASEEDLRPTPVGVLVALEEGLRRRGYRVVVRSVVQEPGMGGWCESPDAGAASVTAPTVA